MSAESEVKIFCIVGAGLSGLVSAKYLLENSFKVVILEKSSNLGGVWLSKSYEGVKLQTTKKSYAFSDFPHFESTSMYPNQHELINYFSEYANRHNLLKYCKFNAEVVQTHFENNKWKIQYKTDNLINKIDVDFLIVASGLYTEPNISSINILDKSQLGKRVFHSQSIKSFEKFKDKNLVIIGNGPTGCDMAVESTKFTKSVSLLYRSNRWIFRRYLWNIISTDFLLNRLLMKIAKHIPKIIFIIAIYIAYYIIYLFGHNEFTPEMCPPFEPVTRQNLVLNEKIVRLIKNEKIKYIKSNNIIVGDDSIIVGNKKIKYDYCILATGYKSNISFLEMESIPYLYKHIIHPQINNCAFIGFAASFNWVQISELQIQWYINYIMGKIKPKSIMEMYESIQYKIDNLNSKAHDYHDLSIIAFDYCDQLATEIGIKNKYSKYNFKYWLSSPENDNWSIRNS